eukprot:TRINITY_DN3370_c0_g2_i4.p2 TRINITY_DN3370_c0_g2~~TRINITY_DN3370_c0_g2_i4.p2  ORF type:complete len:245 (-),score=13.70 TRINITY_DN3370_c0_g2_i4:297-1031(-)
MSDYYSVLGLSRTANDQEIKKAFRKLALKYHPDRLTGQTDKNKLDAALKFKQITEAYNVLSDSAKRKEYNVRFSNQNHPSSSGGRSYSSPEDYRSQSGAYYSYQNTNNTYDSYYYKQWQKQQQQAKQSSNQSKQQGQQAQGRWQNAYTAHFEYGHAAQRRQFAEYHYSRARAANMYSVFVTAFMLWWIANLMTSRNDRALQERHKDHMEEMRRREAELIQRRQAYEALKKKQQESKNVDVRQEP